MIKIIDIKRKIDPTQILDIRTINLAEAGSEFNLVLAKRRMKITTKDHQDEVTKEKFIVESLNLTEAYKLHRRYK